jgi:hypothetical protein
MKHESSAFGAVLTKDEKRILSWCGDNRRILFRSGGHTLRQWDVATGQQIGPRAG